MKKERHSPGDVEIRVKGRNLTVTPALHDQVVRKMQRLDKYHDRLQQIDVELWNENARDADQQCHVEATTHVLGRPIRVCTDHSEMHAAIDEAVDKLYRQLNRQKERLKDHHGNKLGDLPAAEILGSASDAEGLPTESTQVARPPSIIGEYVDLEPLFEDEATEEMNAQGYEFFVFLNARNEKVNVLYRRDDGNYGLIQPRVP